MLPSELFSAGTLVYHIRDDSVLTSDSMELDSSLDWIVFDITTVQTKRLVSCLEASEEKPFPIPDLIFLSTHQYIYITSKTVRASGLETSRTFESESATGTGNNLQSQVILRIYLVPHDLPGMKGRYQRLSVQKVVKPALKILPDLLDKIWRAKSTWQGQPLETEGDSARSPSQFGSLDLVPKFESDNYESLLDIFNNLDVSNFEEEVDGTSLRTQLYAYQKQSVSAMRHMESTTFVRDPLFIPLIGMDEVIFHLQPSTLELRREQPMMARGRGGFLSEELGSGKTLMILALILSDLNSLPPPPDNLSTSSRVLTPLSIRHFPFAHCEDSRTLALSTNRQNFFSDGRFPTLVELCLDYVRTSEDGYDLQQHYPPKSQSGVPLEDHLEHAALLKPLLHNSPFFLQSSPVIEDKKYKTRVAIPDIPRLIYISPATVIVVPPNLMSQWEGQISLHCSRNLRVLVVKGDLKLPSAQQLASSYDIILIASTWLSKLSHIDKQGQQAGYSCKCTAYSKSVRVPLCHCHDGSSSYSPLLCIQFKRLVRDEGHNTAALTELNLFCKSILARSRWIVTGTPTVNLLGLNLGTNTEVGGVQNPASLLATMDLQHLASGDDLDEKLSNDLEDLDSNGSPTNLELENLEYPVRIWSNDEHADLRILGSMLGGFLLVERFSSMGSFAKLVIDPLFPFAPSHGVKAGKKSKAIPLPGAVQVLHQILQMYMVRHLVKDIEAEHPLPPMTQETVALGLHPYAAMTFNVILSGIAVNAVDSAMTDRDYMFHTANRSWLNETMENMSQALFWHRDEEFFDDSLEGMAKNANESLGRAKERGRPGEDLCLLEEAEKHLRTAYSDATFRKMHHLLEVPYGISGLPAMLRAALDSVQRYYSEEIPQSEIAAQNCLVSPSHFLEFQGAVEQRPHMTSAELIELAGLVRKDERERNTIQTTKKRLTKKKAHKGVVSTARAKDLATQIQQQERIAGELRRQMDLVQARRNELTGRGPLANSVASSSQVQHGGQNLRESILCSARITNSLSSKLNFILKEVQDFSAKEKFLIFSSQPLNLVHIAEGLDVLGTSDVYRVFLMELRHGARGLNIISASRIIFCEPVWRPDVESQAIKRAHRIGQTKPVIVKTLVIKSTFEEFMLQRRRELKDNNSGKLPASMTEELGMQHYLKNPTFVQPGMDSEIVLNVPVLRIPEPDSQTEAGKTPQDDLGQRAGKIEIGSLSTPKKRVRLIVNENDAVADASTSGKKVRFG
ncbi:hypothetical protein SCHPADRAFT_291351 [Schizopora paradoxa]|uniref:Uncharacterized protein n=1 Tax=Schizopora paradoxa TaxID=27342 RepID=A0A0H2SDA9_9AGAM|nr:hypothetical protein SCHPADRAFT_291351 [Schizopora paradoxa]